MSKARLYSILAILSSLIGYMEWGTENSTFILAAEIGIILKLFTAPNEVIHPFVLLPLTGQALIFISILVKKGKWLNLSGIILVAVLFLMLLFISIIGLNIKMLLSVLPFFVFAVMSIRAYRKTEN